MNVSVYGTLKKGFRANSMMDNMNFIGESVEQLNFEMVDLGSFPALFESEEKHNITIETYELKDNDKSTLQRLDNYEGYPNFYDRKEITLNNGLVSNIYFIKNKSERYGSGNVVESGNWTRK